MEAPYRGLGRYSLLIAASVSASVALAIVGCGGSAASSNDSTSPNTIQTGDTGTGSTVDRKPKPSRAPLPSAAVSSLRKLIGSLPGRQGIAVLGAGSNVQVIGELRSGTAWSTAKVPVVMASKRLGVGTDADRSSAIVASDNEAALRLWQALGSGQKAAGSADAELRASGDTQTSIQADEILAGYTPFGQTDWSLADQARFMAGMSCTSEGSYALNLMSKVTNGSGYGLPVAFAGARFKGGWGPGIQPGAGASPGLTRQMGLVSTAGKRAAVAIVSASSSEAQNQQQLTQLATALKRQFPGSALSSRVQKRCG